MLRFSAIGFLSLFVLTHAAQAQVIFEDDFSTGDNFDVVADPDTNVGFGFDYSDSDVPPAPNGNDTIGLYTIANFSDPAEAAGVAVIYFDPDLTGQYTVTVDVWNNWHLDIDSNPNNSGTTEFTGLSVGHTGEYAGVDGASFIFDGDGDSGSDYRMYKNLEFQSVDSGQYLLDEYDVDGVRRDLDNSNPQLTEAFPGFEVNDVVPLQGLNGRQRDGAAGFQWMTVTAEVDTEAIGVGTTNDPGVATFKLKSHKSGNEVTIGRIDNSNGQGEPVLMDGAVAVMMMDIFSSVSPSITHSFGLFDNLKIVRGIGGGTTVDVDFDGNGRVDVADVDALVGAIVSGSDDASFDLNGDSVVNDSDLSKWLSDAATANGLQNAYFSGDANLDGTVDAGDLNAVGLNWQESVEGWSLGDFTADGLVDASDLNDVGLNWQKTASAAATAAVPEPGSLETLLLAWLAIHPLFRRLRRSA